MGFATSAHYLLYWKLSPEERLNLAEYRRADYAAGDQLEKVKPGDVLWIVNVYVNKLWLLGRLQVETVVSDSDVAQELVEPGEDWIDADWYAIANRFRVEPLKLIDITGIAAQLRLFGRTDRLTFTQGRIDAKQFRWLRELTPDSAWLLEEIWYAEKVEPQSTQDYLELTEDDRAYTEGRIVERTLRQRQRNRQLVEDAKAQYKQNHGRLCCEVCGFDFIETYGIEYIEAHHIQAVASLDEDHESVTADLVMLCANCHRAVHSETPPLTIEQLKAIIEENRG